MEEEEKESKGEGLREPIKADRILDAIGFFCPEPILKTRREMDQMNIGEVLEVMADDPGSVEDIPKWAKRAGQEFLIMNRQDHHCRFLVRKVK